MLTLLSDSKQQSAVSPAAKRAVPKSDKAISTLKFSQQVATLKEKYAGRDMRMPNSRQTSKESEHFLTLYDKYIARQKEQTTQSVSFKSSQSQTTHNQNSVHQMSHSQQHQQSPPPPKPPTNYNLHRLSLDNFRTQQLCSSDLSSSIKGLKLSINKYHQSKTQNEKKPPQLNFHLKDPILQPAHLISSYYTKSTSDDAHMNAIKYLSLGGRSSTIDQIEFKEQLTGRESHLSSQQADEEVPKQSRYENILQSLVYRNVDERMPPPRRVDQDQNYFSKEQPQPPSQPSSTKNADASYRFVVQNTLSNKVVSENSEQKQRHYFQFPTQPKREDLEGVLRRTREILGQYKERESHWKQEKGELTTRLRETSELYQQSLKEIRRLKQLILQQEIEDEFQRAFSKQI